MKKIIVFLLTALLMFSVAFADSVPMSKEDQMASLVKNFLEENESRYISDILHAHYDIFAVGHTHGMKAIYEHDDKGCIFISVAAGNLYDNLHKEDPKYKNGFTLLDFNENARYRNYEGAFYWLKDAGLINIAYNTTEPNIGLGQRIDDNSLKCYFFDTGLLLALVFNEREITKEEIYKKILFDKLSFNEGMIMENIIAQTLTSIGRKLYFFSKYNSENANETMEIDFLITKDTITSKHNIIPIEVKSGDRYTYSSLNKLRDKYKDYIDRPIIIHTKDLKEENGILYLPIYMTCLL